MRRLLRVAWAVVRGDTCTLFGCDDGSWVLGVALGHERPVCTRCKRVL